MGIQNFSLRSVGSYLQENIYYIPDYQREYSWDQDSQIDDFWTDLETVVKEDRKQHFFGQIVIHNSASDDKKYIIDGQQRTSTSVIYLCALYKLFEELYRIHNHRPSKNRTDDLTTKYIGRWEEDENELRLHLGKTDREFFMKHIQLGEDVEDEKNLTTSNKRINDAYKYFIRNLETLLINCGTVEEKYKILHAYYTKFIDGFTVMYLETDDINEAFIIFETLNDRGKDLETADLLKNHLFRISNKSLDLIKEQWQTMNDNLDKIDTTKFIRHFWNSRYNFIREKDLYKRIREEITTPKKCEELVHELLHLSELYRALVNANDETYFADSELNSILANLKLLKASSFYPIILALKSCNYTEEDIKIVSKALETLVVRNFVISGKVANKYEIVFSKIAFNVYHKEYTTVEDIIEKIHKNTINDEEFESAFSLYSSKNKGTIRYLFRELNKYLDQETEIINDNTKVHIEHIMPEKKGNWYINEEEHTEYLWRLGNLTLLGKEYNKAISNKIFQEKRTIYTASSILLSRELPTYTTWGTEEIKDRQEKLAKLALKVWSIH